MKYNILFTLWSAMLGSELIFFPHSQNILCFSFIKMDKQTENENPTKNADSLFL